MRRIFMGHLDAPPRLGWHFIGRRLEGSLPSAGEGAEGGGGRLDSIQVRVAASGGRFSWLKRLELLSPSGPETFVPNGVPSSS